MSYNGAKGKTQSKKRKINDSEREIVSFVVNVSNKITNYWNISQNCITTKKIISLPCLYDVVINTANKFKSDTSKFVQS
jgi:hypothetical protein